jgi:hypothetical protein
LRRGPRADGRPDPNALRPWALAARSSSAARASMTPDGRLAGGRDAHGANARTTRAVHGHPKVAIFLRGTAEARRRTRSRSTARAVTGTRCTPRDLRSKEGSGVLRAWRRDVVVRRFASRCRAQVEAVAAEVLGPHHALQDVREELRPAPHSETTIDGTAVPPGPGAPGIEFDAVNPVRLHDARTVFEVRYIAQALRSRTGAVAGARVALGPRDLATRDQFSTIRRCPQSTQYSHCRRRASA